MAIPYVILTSRPALLKKLPKPGNWMVTFKQFMGFLLLATVVYLMISVRQDLLLFTVAFLTVIALACFIWGKYATLDRSKPARTMIFAISALIVIAGGYLIFVPFQSAYTRNPLIAGVEDGFVWQNFHPEKFREYLNDNRNIFLVFTADWCPNCKWNENVVYDSKPIRLLLKEKNVVGIMADMTHSGPETKVIEKLRKKLGGNAVPYLAVFPADTPLRPFVRHGIVTGSDIREILQSL
jgi:thiol:disulfide interchange protein DsbD